jgi:hypothetical protein
MNEQVQKLVSQRQLIEGEIYCTDVEMEYLRRKRAELIGQVAVIDARIAYVEEESCELQ